MSPFPSPSLSAASSTAFRFLPAGLGDTEDLERYAPGGLHPVSLGDVYDERYRVVHKLGAGGFSTVWLARDEAEQRWVALKIVVADHSAAIETKHVANQQAALRCGSQADSKLAVEYRRFTIDGPNGRHLCLVLPVLGPSASQLSCFLDSRITPRLARKAAYQAAQALANLHAQGLCHGDMTTANIAFGLSDIDRYTEDHLFNLFGTPETAPLETESGEEPGPEAPPFIVKPLDFLASEENIIRWDVQLLDFDQSFPTSSPPEDMLGTPPEFLAPEVAVGLSASPASDVWALGCSIFRLRSGQGPFSSIEVWSPGEALVIIVRTLGNLPDEWQRVLFDHQGQPTRDHEKGTPLPESTDSRSLRDLVYNIYDKPENGIVETGKIRPGYQAWDEAENVPYPPSFADMAWKPKATKIDNVYLHGYDDETDELLKAMPKIPETEAALLHDLLSKVFVYDPAERITVEEMLSHSWFHMDRGDPLPHGH
ncbi:kinase-like protein [Chaetomidium leptoderma]|uniref:Kinase-like protein n=1 Tax=Chaetomidium leptoderma TaxID=669021 RepID=A0AAN6VY24_9PEZI|nr:kinase-like protein [Chaetomidium leptoderma]